MPNRNVKLGAFHGGLNDSADARDIQDEELSLARGLSVHKLGKVVVAGGKGDSLSNIGSITNRVVKGYGLHYFSTDRNSEETETSEDWIAYYGAEDGKVNFYYRNKAGASIDGLKAGGASTQSDTKVELEVTLASNSPTSAAPAFYNADGALRISDGNFDADNRNKWHGFVNHKLWENSSTTNIQTITQWYNTEQQLKSFDDLGVTLSLRSGYATNPADSNLSGNQVANDMTPPKKIIMNLWGSDDGNWNGTFQFAATPIYEGGGEGPISEFSKSKTFKDKKIIFQLFIPVGLWDDSDATIDEAVSNADVPMALNDDRITGMVMYFRSHGGEDWHKLKKIDFLEGGKHRWGLYKGAENTYGIGDFTITFGNSSGQTAVGNVFADDESYKNTYIKFSVANSLNTGFTDRNGFLRVYGGEVSPVYKNEIDTSGSHSDSVSSGTITSGDLIPLDYGSYGSNKIYFAVPITTPAAGEREFFVELLDENFNVIAESSKTTYTIGDSGNSPPPSYSDADNPTVSS